MEGGGEGGGGRENGRMLLENLCLSSCIMTCFFFYCLLLVFPNHVIIQKTRFDINQRDKTASLFHLLHFFE